MESLRNGKLDGKVKLTEMIELTDIVVIIHNRS